MNVSQVAATQKHAGCEEESNRVIAPPHPTLLFACRTARPQHDIESKGNWQEQQKKEWDEVLVECKTQNTTPGKRWWWGSCVGSCSCCWVNQYFCNVATQATANDSKHHEKIWEQEGERNEKDKKGTVK